MPGIVAGLRALVVIDGVIDGEACMNGPDLLIYGSSAISFSEHLLEDGLQSLRRRQ